MCSRATCSRCKKATWSGCGRHVNQVLAGIPKSKQCDCAKNVPAPSEQGGFLARIFGR
jgi:hypothetical protein